MEITKYLCEFFFTNFWHWIGLVLLCAVIFRIQLIKIGKSSKHEV